MEAIRALGVKVHYYRCDLNNAESFAAAVQNLKADFGQVDGLVHFAGLERSKLAMDKAVEEFTLIFNVKANSAINLWKAGVVKDDLVRLGGKEFQWSDAAAPTGRSSKFAYKYRKFDQEY